MLKCVYIVFTHLPLFLDMFPKPQARLEEKNDRLISKPIGLLVLWQDTSSKTSVGYFAFRLLERKHPKYTLKCLFYYSFLHLFASKDFTYNRYLSRPFLKKLVFRNLHFSSTCIHQTFSLILFPPKF